MRKRWERKKADYRFSISTMSWACINFGEECENIIFNLIPSISFKWSYLDNKRIPPRDAQKYRCCYSFSLITGFLCWYNETHFSYRIKK